MMILTSLLSTAIMATPFPDGVTMHHEMVPMRDGVRLSVYRFTPAGKGPWPVLLEQRYASLTSPGSQRRFAKLAAGGYVVIAANFRGSQLSEGVWVGYRALAWGEKQDGFDLVEWAAQQPWSTGKVGTFGGSQAGFAQNFLAVTQPPHLVAQYMVDTGLSLFHEGYRIGGTARPERFKTMDAVCRVPMHNRQLSAEWYRHTSYDDYWKDEDCSRHFDRMNVPCFTVGSWFDFMNVGSIDSFVGRQHRGGPNSRGKQQLIIGPWLHGGDKNAAKVGEMVFPDTARFDLDAHLLRWFDFHLKGKPSGVERDPAVRYYVMGPVGEPGAPGNQYRTAKDWPIPAHDTRYFLRSEGRLTTEPPAADEAPTSYRADPLHPVSIPGRGFPGARDARDVEKQADVRTFTTAPLTEAIEWTGKVRADLKVASTAKDCDFIVRVSDVYPDGRSMLLIDYVRRARYREGYDKEVPLVPGQVTNVAFDVGWLSQVFAKGHRIRVTVCSTGAPFYEPNPNTGEPLTEEFPANPVVATNTIHHRASAASCIIAPIVRGE